jgi:glycosyltransferase involved in cell wall biosynthesis
LKIRVLETLATLRRAGAEQVAVSLACGLSPSRFETGVVTLYDAFPGGLDSVLEAHGAPVWRLGKRRGPDPRMWPRLARVLRDFRPDVIHTHSYVLRYVLPAWALERRGMVVHTVHNVAEKEVDALGRAFHRLAFRAGVRPVAVSGEVARSFRAVYGFEPAALIPNGVVTAGAVEPGSREAWRTAHGFASDDLLVASVGRFDPQKNPLGLIAAFARAAAGRPALRLAMAGEGALLEASRALAEKLGIGARVSFLGLLERVPEMLSACDLFALASHWEGAPMAVIEAMAAGLPVVATAVGGVPELVVDGENGLLTPPGDAEALAAALAALADGPEKRLRFGAAAGLRAVRFDVGAMVESYAAFFEDAAGRWMPT